MINIFWDLLGNNTFQTRFRVAPNTFTKVDLDVAVDKYITSSSDLTIQYWVDPDSTPPDNAIIQPQVYMFKKPDGTVIGTQTINNQPIEYCNRYFDQHVSFSYTSDVQRNTSPRM